MNKIFNNFFFWLDTNLCPNRIKDYEDLLLVPLDLVLNIIFKIKNLEKQVI